MALTRLDIVNFRNLSAVKLDAFANEINFFYGQNGSGKTSLLEAIYYLSRGRSFRCSLSGRIINNDATKFSIFAQILAPSSTLIPIGIERNRQGERSLHAAGQENIAITELATLFPALLLNSNCYNLLEGGPLFRRKYLDWGGFYTNERFLTIWKQFERALKQRNAVLRSGGTDNELAAWSKELIQNALLLDEMRHLLMQSLQLIIGETTAELLPFDNMNIHYYSGWNKESTYAEILNQSIKRDRELGFTQYGPHRADIKITINRIPLKDILSRGQQKLFVCAMIVAQGALLQQSVGRKPIYLVDDLPSELDSISRSNLMTVLLRQKAQVFLTAVDSDVLKMCCPSTTLMKMFHVERGNIKEVTK